MQREKYTAVALTAEDRKLFENYVKGNMKRAYFSALSILGNHDDAMELSQEAFLRAYRYFPSFDKSKKFFTWYYKILRNLCLNSIRDNKNRKEVALLENLASETTIGSSIEKNELKAIVESALMKLEPDDREILTLKEFENHSYKEIAELLNIPIGTVMSKLFYSRKKLAVLLEGVKL